MRMDNFARWICESSKKKSGNYLKKNKRSFSKLGDKNPQWKGEKITYSALHSYIRRHLKNKKCYFCNRRKNLDVAYKNMRASPKKRYLYSRNLKNWFWLCRKCHVTFDGRLQKILEYNKKRKKDPQLHFRYNGTILCNNPFDNLFLTNDIFNVTCKRCKIIYERLGDRIKNICDCRKSFMTRICMIKNNRGKYCSRKCFYKYHGRKKGLTYRTVKNFYNTTENKSMVRL